MNNNTLQLRIELDNIKPPIWRRVLVDENTSLNDLHYIIQASFGWFNAHLYQFIKGRDYFGDIGILEDDDILDDSKVKIKQLLNKKNDIIKYEYDMGDSWIHSIKLEEVLPSDKTIQTPTCVKGARNCPPEDCGGIPGYMHLVETMKKPKSKEYKEFIEWIGEKYNPEHFDLEEINEELIGLQ